MRAGCREHVRHLCLRRRVGAHVDGELSPGRRAETAAHLVRCWTCSGHAETLRLIKHSLGSGPGRAPSSLTGARLRRYAVRLGADPTDR